MKLSVLVVTYNDEKFLEECLYPLRRFDETIVVDLGSNDHSIEVAEKMGANVHKRPWVPAIELILPDLTDLAYNDWILRVDPDEVFSPSLVDELLTLEVNDEYGMVTIPFQYHFLGRKLDTTVWGGVKDGSRISHKKRTFFETEVHRTHKCKDNYKTYNIKFSGSNFVAHYWVDSFSQMFSKHQRYLKLEGKSRFSKGDRFSWKKLIKYTVVNLKLCFIDTSGWRGGWIGWFLSFFYAQYEARSWLALRQYEKQMQKAQKIKL